MPRPQVTLDPKVQAQLLAQMREEQTAAIRSRRIRIFVMVPAVIALLLVSTILMFSDDHATAMISNLFASLLGWQLWKHRKR